MIACAGLRTLPVHGGLGRSAVRDAPVSQPAGVHGAVQLCAPGGQSGPPAQDAASLRPFPRHGPARLPVALRRLLTLSRTTQRHPPLRHQEQHLDAGQCAVAIASRLVFNKGEISTYLELKEMLIPISLNNLRLL